MKILIVHNFYQQEGGEDRIARFEVDLLRSYGQEVDVFFTSNDEIYDLWTKLKTAVLAIYNPWSKQALKKKILSFRPDIVHVHNFFPQFSPSIFDACQETSVPVVMTLHNYRILCPSAFLYHDSRLREYSLKRSSFWTVRKRTYRGSYVGTFFVYLMVEYHKWRKTWHTKVDLFLALTEFSKSKFIEGGIPGNKIVVKPHSAVWPPTEVIRSEPRHGALFVGRLSVEKGLLTLLAAWNGLDYPLRIVGEGPLDVNLDAASIPQLIRLGHLSPENVRAEMLKAAFLVVPSEWYEMFGLVIVEAFACGLPVICSRLGSLAEIVEDGKTGVTFSPGDSVSLREAVDWAIDHPLEIRDMGSNAISICKTKYTRLNNFITLTNIYRDAVRGYETPPH